MSDFTNFTEQNVRDWMSQGTDMPTAQSELWISLHTSDPGETPDGSTEVSASDYQRAKTSAGLDWDTSTSGDAEQFVNNSAISFSQATNDWGTVSHVGIWDTSAVGSGNATAAFALDSSKTINTDDTAKFNSGNLDFVIN